MRPLDYNTLHGNTFRNVRNHFSVLHGTNRLIPGDLDDCGNGLRHFKKKGYGSKSLASINTLGSGSFCLDVQSRTDIDN